MLVGGVCYVGICGTSKQGRQMKAGLIVLRDDGKDGDELFIYEHDLGGRLRLASLTTKHFAVIPWEESITRSLIEEPRES